jgi:hypothetical protein
MSDLNELLADIGDRARIYDVTERALVLGRRRRNTRRLAGVGGIAAAVALSITGALVLPTRPEPGPAAPPSPTPSPPTVALTACTASELPMPEGLRADTYHEFGGDPSGRFQATRATDGKGRDFLVVWEDGSPRVVSEWPKGAVRINAVSSTGTVLLRAGQAELKSWVVRRDGTTTRPLGPGAVGLGINSAGVIVGQIQGNLLMTWRDATAKPVPLPVPDGMTAGDPAAISDDGTVVTQLFEGRFEQTPFRRFGPGWAYVWPPGGSPQRLALPDAIDGVKVKSSRVFQIADGWASGVLITGEGEDIRPYPARWRLGSGEVEWLAVPDRGEGVVNPQGWAVLRAADDTTTLVRGDVAIRLTGLPGHTPRPSDVTGTAPLMVSVVGPDARALFGLQVSEGENRELVYRRLRWTCH